MLYSSVDEVDNKSDPTALKLVQNYLALIIISISIFENYFCVSLKVNASWKIFSHSSFKSTSSFGRNNSNKLSL